MTWNPRYVWLFLAIAGFLYEGWALGTRHVEYSLSYQIWVIRHDAVGRFLVWMFFCWFFMHIVLAPYWMGVQPDGPRGLVALGVGFGFALGETLLHKH